MCMKINRLSTNRRAKTGMGAWAKYSYVFSGSLFHHREDARAGATPPCLAAGRGTYNIPHGLKALPDRRTVAKPELSCGSKRPDKVIRDTMPL